MSLKMYGADKLYGKHYGGCEQVLCYTTTTTTTTTQCVVRAKLANSYCVFMFCCLPLIGSLAVLNYLLMPPVATQQVIKNIDMLLFNHIM